ncbi:hypothetical protein VK792_11530 [Mesobacterium sp. TK19101]|uniref:Uncharacterized protein n=1 Tax=Mesobacterium hydrothermale TaxID=3111907 RepID=A0ABU6HHH6_9RHOB|nr:hypothetical protein [Mesobacterium sp. TK19101]MEC3861915.1 hypothetical protein [Mesobacterium sp. TK19101]
MIRPPRVPHLRLIQKAREDRFADEHIPPLMPRLVIPMCDRTEDVRAHNRYFEQGQFLSRQEAWAELGELIRSFDQRRVTTPGGTPVAAVLAAGARADAVEAAAAAVRRFDETGARDTLLALEDILEDNSEDHGVALVVALAHIDIGWAWRGESWGLELPTLNKGGFHSHFNAAARIIDRFDPFELDAPTLAAARCALLAAERRPDQRVADDYEDLIDLDPASPGHMRAMGVHLLPRWFGSYEQLELQARRTAARTIDLWGAGGYTWVYLDALAMDDGAFERLDPEFFIEGMCDILALQPEQHTVNLFAAFTGQTLSGWSEPGSNRARVAECFDWIARDFLREVHPVVWMQDVTPVLHPAPLPTTRDTQRKGRVRALSALAEHFAPQIRAGNRVIFDADGVSVVPA